MGSQAENGVDSLSVCLLGSLEFISPCTFLYLLNAFLLAGTMKNLKVLNFKKCIFGVSSMKGREGWAGSQSCRMLLDNEQSLFLCPAWVSVAGAGLPQQFPGRDLTASSTQQVWVAFSNSLVICSLSHSQHYYSHLQSFLLHHYHPIFFFFFGKWIYALWTQFCHLPQIFLEAIGSLTVRVMLFRRCCVLWAVCAKALLSIPPRGSHGREVLT